MTRAKDGHDRGAPSMLRRFLLPLAVVVSGLTMTMMTAHRVALFGRSGPLGGELAVAGSSPAPLSDLPMLIFDLPMLIAGITLTLVGCALAVWGQRSVRRLASDVDDVRRSRDRYASFLEAMVATIDLGIIACNEQGMITVSNEALWRRHSGVSPTDAPLHDLALQDWDGRIYPTEELPLQRALHGEHVRDEEFEVRIDGRRRTHLINARQIRDGEDNVIGAVLALHDITDRTAFEARMTHLAMRDDLTGLANRRRLGQDLREALATQRAGGPVLTLLFLDIDRFKVVNDINGHHRGDQMLIDIAGRLSAMAHDGDVAARMGGDEFVLLCPHQPSAPAAHWLAREVSEALAPALVVDGDTGVQGGISIGVVRPGDDATVEDVLRHADLAMYDAKRERTTSITVYEPSLGDQATAHFATESALRPAVALRALNVAYQPIIDVGRERVVAVEALVRWKRDGRQQLPDTFLPLAEETGLITEIDLLVLDKACEALTASPGGARVNVNLSARAVGLPYLAETVRDILLARGLTPDRLCLELTESALIGASTSMDRSLADLAEMGVTLALDDFGTGYASLNYLRRFPVHVIKIDRSFVQDLLTSDEDRAIVESTVHLATRLGLRTVAEGVETVAQAEVLAELGCDMLQGFLFSRPTTLERALAADAHILRPAPAEVS